MISAVRYHGPTLTELHEQYAKQRRVDEAAPIRSSHEVHIDAPIEAVWALLGDPDRWSAIDPAIHDVRLDGPVAVETRFTWRNGSTKLRSQFAVVDPGREISWTGSAMGSRAVHRHVLTPVGESGTLLRTEESMAGTLLALVFNSRKLHTVLVQWLEAVKVAAERS